eukprot:13103971-Ditylum_brightwellii.AAC.1
MSKGNLPMRCLLSADLNNMFNRMLQKQLRWTLNDKFRHLLTLFDCLYQGKNTVFYCQADGTLDIIYQHEGFTQGCPLSSVFASLVLGIVLAKLNIKLHQRIQARNQQNDNGWAETIAFMDDASNALLFQDVHWYLKELVRIGKIYGIVLNLKKTKILTNIIGQYILDFPLTLEARLSLKNALAMLDKGEVMDGLTIVGTPIGSNHYVQTKLDEIAATATAATTTIFATVPDPHMATQLYTKSVLQRFPFHMATDVRTFATLEEPNNTHD